jgi:hypothetical protein
MGGNLEYSAEFATTNVLDVAGLVTVVTGGAQGLGFAFADVMAAGGARWC